jgi:hypothetical protein
MSMMPPKRKVRPGVYERGQAAGAEQESLAMALRDPLTPGQVSDWLGRSSGWSGSTAGIRKTFAVVYDDAIQIVTEVGAAAIELEHRPDIDIRWTGLPSP